MAAWKSSHSSVVKVNSTPIKFSFCNSSVPLTKNKYYP